MEEPPLIRRATLQDAEILTQQRRAIAAATGTTDVCILDTIASNFSSWVREKLARDEYLGWLAVDGSGDDEYVIAGAGLWLMDWPLSARNLSGKNPYIMNVYTHPAYRRLGLGRELVAIMVDYCRENSFPFATLHTTQSGRPLYETMGFHETCEMQLDLQEALMPIALPIYEYVPMRG